MKVIVVVFTRHWFYLLSIFILSGTCVPYIIKLTLQDSLSLKILLNHSSHFSFWWKICFLMAIDCKHINDISRNKDFAVDCVWYCQVKEKEDLVKLQNDTDRPECWVMKSGMRFQLVKCSMMQVTKDQCWVHFRGHLSSKCRKK